MDYYELLGIERDATVGEIKRAYRRAAFRTHPDRNPVERKRECEREFKQISEAYQVLSDPIQRKIYDCSGKTDDFIDFVGAKELFKELFPEISADISDETWKIIDDVFGDIENGKSFMEIAKGLPYMKILKTQLPNVIDIAREYFRDFSSQSSPSTKVSSSGRPKPVVIVNKFSLESVHERDQIVIRYPFLRYEDGETVIKEEEIVIDNYLENQKIYIENNGHEYESGKYSGLILYNKVLPHPRFRRKSTYDLYVVQRVNITDLVMRRNLYFKWIDGSNLEIPLSQSLLNLSVIKLPGWGLKYLGDLFIHFQINHIVTTDYDKLKEIQELSTKPYEGKQDDLHIGIDCKKVKMLFDDR